MSGRTDDDAAGTLYLVATPIGNLEDITHRALRVLGEVDIVACEDTRHTRTLLNHFRINAKTVSYHEHNEHERAVELTARLSEGASVALVSDAGTPAINDPGFRLVRSCVERGIRVVPVPGATAFVAAHVAGLLPIAIVAALAGFGALAIVAAAFAPITIVAAVAGFDTFAVVAPLAAIGTLAIVVAVGALAILAAGALDTLLFLGRVFAVGDHVLVALILVAIFVVAVTGTLLLEPRAVLVEHAEIMFGELEVGFALDAVAAELRVAGQLLVLFKQLRRIPTLAIVLAIAARSAAGNAAPAAAAATAAPATALPIVDQMEIPINSLGQKMLFSASHTPGSAQPRSLQDPRGSIAPAGPWPPPTEAARASQAPCGEAIGVGDGRLRDVERAISSGLKSPVPAPI